MISFLSVACFKCFEAIYLLKISKYLYIKCEIDYSRSVESLPSKGDAVHDRNYTGLIENSRQAVPVDQSEYVAAGLNSLSNGSSVPSKFI